MKVWIRSNIEIIEESYNTQKQKMHVTDGAAIINF